MLLYLLPILITLFGGYMMIRLRFFFILHPIKTLRFIKRSLSTSGGKESLALALAGTLGVGNIIGVAVGVSIGGAGCVIWLLVSSLFASIIKFSEASLVGILSDGTGVGMICVIKNSNKKFGKSLSRIYAVLCILLAFFMGASLQTSSAFECLTDGSVAAKCMFCVVFLTSLTIVVIKGDELVSKFALYAIPIASMIYICLSLSCVILNYERIPAVLKEIAASAFAPSGIGGGVIGFLTSTVIKEGYSRGLLSNEAGAGTSSFAHAKNSKADPFSLGMLGFFEVIFDTAILCTLTAFAILVRIPNPTAYTSGVKLVVDSIGAVFGDLSRHLIFVCISVFAFSTVVCWYYYGSVCVNYLCKGRFTNLYIITFLLAVILGFFEKINIFVLFSDYILLLLTLITLLSVIKNSGRIVALPEFDDF